jgi:hypothetical protein
MGGGYRDGGMREPRAMMWLFGFIGVLCTLYLVVAIFDPGLRAYIFSNAKRGTLTLVGASGGLGAAAGIWYTRLRNRPRPK